MSRKALGRTSDGGESGFTPDAPGNRGGQAAARVLEPAQQEDYTMETLLMKLQALNYERDFCRRKRPFRPALSTQYFAYQASGAAGNEQFVYFTQLAAWLLKAAGVSQAAAKEFDDPNTTLSNLLQGCKGLGFGPPSFPQAKLLAGWGKEVVGMLDALADMALERSGWTPAPISRPLPGMQDYVEEDAEAAGASADIAERALVASPEASEEELVFSGARQSSAGMVVDAVAATAAADQQILVSTVDPTAWRLEVERVAPKLRITLAADARDWRQHLDAAAAAAKKLQGLWPDAQSALQRVLGEVTSSLEKLGSREAGLNSSFQGMLGSYRGAREQLVTAQQEYNRRTEALSENNNELHRVIAALEEAKAQLDNRGSSLSDASPLVRIKAALGSLQEELGAMEVRIGVVSHSLLQLSLRDKQANLRDAAAAAAGGSRGADSAKKRVAGGKGGSGVGGRRVSGSRR